jgi:hypothetical protein
MKHLKPPRIGMMTSPSKFQPTSTRQLLAAFGSKPRRTELLIENQWPQTQKLACAVQENGKFTDNGRFTSADIRHLLA